jgi:hypothetical protein
MRGLGERESKCLWRRRLYNMGILVHCMGGVMDYMDNSTHGFESRYFGFEKWTAVYKFMARTGGQLRTRCNFKRT